MEVIILDLIQGDKKTKALKLAKNANKIVNEKVVKLIQEKGLRCHLTFFKIDGEFNVYSFDVPGKPAQ